MDEFNGGYLTSECKDCPYWLDGSTWDFGCGNHEFNECLHAMKTAEDKRRFKYLYDGPVMIFDRRVVNKWRCETTAISESKARNNLLYRWKKENGYAPNAKVTLPGRFTIVG